MRNKKKVLVGVTGNLGSGKSLVCKYFEEFGSEVFYADDIAKELYKSNKELRTQLRSEIGDFIYNDNVISQTKLREFIISSKKNQKLINSIVHPIVIDEILKLAARSRSRLIMIEAALIFESGFDKYLDYVIVVTAPLTKRIERVKKRSKLTLGDILKITKLQLSEKIKKQKGDFVISNDSTKKELKKSASYIFDTLNKVVD
jgi:dephospho-CoA kinase